MESAQPLVRERPCLCKYNSVFSFAEWGGEDAGEEKEANAGNWLRGAKSKNPTIAVFEAKSAPKWLNHAVF